MKIWQVEMTLAALAAGAKNTMIEHLGIEFTEIGDNFLKARMPVDHRTKQPAGIMHGGASCVLAETIGSMAAYCCIDPSKFQIVGLDINTNHIRSVREAYVTGIAEPFHLGRSSQVWGIKIMNDNEQLISVSRLTIAILSK